MLAWLLLPLALVAMAGAANMTSTPLRIMALGASVSFGIGSTTGDSYRKDLEDLLTATSNTVAFVGTKANGNFSNNAVEATGGFVISQIVAAASAAVPKLLPNLVLVDAGTNNCNSGGTVPDAGTNITNMINNIYGQSPGSTVILTTILVNSVAAQDACRLDENNQITSLAVKMQAEGQKLVLVDMRGPGGPLVTDLADGRHPNDAGYRKMANIWHGGVQEAIVKGFLGPDTNGTSEGSASITGKSSSSASSVAAMSSAMTTGSITSQAAQGPSPGNTTKTPTKKYGTIDLIVIVLGLGVGYLVM
jgi:lysophospholipase L1-like esterase